MDSPHHRLRTLIVDDDPSSAALTRHALVLTDCFDIVGQAVDAHDARLLAETLHPDLILLDVDIPGADGFAALPYIQEASPHSHIVMMSGPDPDADRRRAAVAQVDLLPKESTKGVFEMLGRALLQTQSRA